MESEIVVSNFFVNLLITDDENMTRYGKKLSGYHIGK